MPAVTKKKKGADEKPLKTLRDEFAMAALTGLLARDNYEIEQNVILAYNYADEMMEMRAVSDPNCNKEKKENG